MADVTTYSDTTQEFLELLGSEDYRSQELDILESGESRYRADLKVNFKNALESEHITKKEISLLGLALATNAGNTVLKKFFVSLAVDNGATSAEQAEAIGCASLLSANNVFYRFRHFIEKPKYEELPARIKMNIMAKPVTSKEFFELMSLAISAVNGCQRCIQSHEASLLELGGKEERIFDAVRLAAIITSLAKIIY